MSSLLTFSIVLTLACGALSFGGVYAWAFRPLLIACTAVGAVALVVGARKRPLDDGITTGGRSGLRPLFIALFAVTLAASLQLIPVSRSALLRLSPAADALLQQHDLRYAANPSLPHPLSIDPAAGLQALAFLVALSIFFIGLTKALSVLSWRVLFRGLVMLGAALAVVGLVQKATFTREVYGFWSSQDGGEPFGPFLNKNHFAGWMLMNLPLAIGYLYALVGIRRPTGRSWRQRVLWLSSPQANEVLLVGAAIVLMAFALVLTLSRSGIGALVFAIGLSGWLTARRHANHRPKVLLPLLAVLPVVAISWAGSDDVFARFAAVPGSGLGGRVEIWIDTVAIVKDFLLTGAGLSAYATAMLFYQQHGLPAYYAWAHNDYLQLLAEGGLLLGIPTIVLVAFFVREVRRRLIEKAAPEICAVRLGAMIALCAIAIQEFVDFSLQIPANAMLFCLLCALCVARPPVTFGSLRERLIAPSAKARTASH